MFLLALEGVLSAILRVPAEEEKRRARDDGKGEMIEEEEESDGKDENAQ